MCTNPAAKSIRHIGNDTHATYWLNVDVARSLYIHIRAEIKNVIDENKNYFSLRAY